MDTEKRHSILDYTIHSYSIPGRNASLQNTSKALAHTTQSTAKTTTPKQLISLHISQYLHLFTTGKGTSGQKKSMSNENG